MDELVVKDLIEAAGALMLQMSCLIFSLMI